MQNPSQLPEPDAAALAHSRTLEDTIRTRIDEAGGAISFADFMEMALYEPGQGYYAAGARRFGAAGDFVTAPELGGLFACSLTRQLAEVAEQLDGDWALLEIGAGDGSLARDLLAALPEHLHPSGYSILERSASLKHIQSEKLSRAPVPITWLDQPPDTGWQGVLLANEVIDALSVERFRLGKETIEQQIVVVDEGDLRLDFRPAPARLCLAVTHLMDDLNEPLAEGYTSELCISLTPWLKSLTANLQRGLSLWVDYGYPRREFYSPQRSMGTLIGHYRHRVLYDPLQWPGLQDLTASVDFTAVAEAGDAAGLSLAGYTTQASFLLGLGITDLLDEAFLDVAGRLRQSAELKQLLLPGEMGERFQVMGLHRGLTAELSGFEFSDLSHRL